MEHPANELVNFEQTLLSFVNNSWLIVCLISDQYIGHLLNRNLLMSYIDFAEKLFETCGMNPKAANIPIRVSLSTT
jgi:hypothetical protein